MRRRIGQLRDRVVIQRRATTGDTQGGRAATPEALATVWAHVIALSGDEQLQAQAIGSNVLYDVEIRYRPDVTAQMRLLWTPYMGSAKTFQIASVRLKDGRPDRLVLSCSEIT